MEKQKIEPAKITKPIQLLAAWLVGLILVNGSFLSAAGIIHDPKWIVPVLVIAAVVNVPVFLVCIFLLQTKFRPEMQEDTYYSTYLKDRMSGKEIKSAVYEDMVPVSLVESYKSNLTAIEEVYKKLEMSYSAMVDKVQQEDGERHAEAITIFKADIVNTEKEFKEIKKDIEWKTTQIHINTELTQYINIENDLLHNGLKIAHYFGSKEDPPSTFLISIGKGVTVDQIVEVLRILTPYNPQGLQYILDDMYIEDIYIGSYGCKELKYTDITDAEINVIVNGNNKLLMNKLFSSPVEAKAKSNQT